MSGASTTVLDTQTGVDFSMSAQEGYSGTFEQGYRQLIAAAPTASNVVSEATSPWQPASGLFGTEPAVYGEPIVAQVLPFDTEIEIDYRGAEDFQGTGATDWSASPSVADGLNWLQFRARFRASALTGARPILTNIIVPQE